MSGEPRLVRRPLVVISPDTGNTGDDRVIVGNDGAAFERAFGQASG
jgi:hypothetical protein